MSDPRSDVRVWDPLVRVGHWILVIAFLVAYLTEGEPEEVHVIAGYVIGTYVVVRTIWGFVGSRHARFSDFVRGPREIAADLAGLVAGRRVRHLGHNPAGGAMVVALLLSLAATVALGLATYADTENEGPLAPWLGEDRPAIVTPPGVTSSPRMAPVQDVDKEAEREGHARRESRDDAEAADEHEESESPFAEWHEVFANLTLALVLLHVIGVVVDSRMHRENLVGAMITGTKTVAADPAPDRRH